MSSKEKNTDQREKIPNHDDKGFWKDFDIELIKTLRKAKIESLEAQKPKKCLTFARCHEIAQDLNSLTVAEQSHLTECHSCNFRLEEFKARMPIVVVVDTPLDNIANIVENKGIIAKLENLFRITLMMRPIAIGLGLIAVLGGAFIVFQIFRSSQPIEQTVLLPANDDLKIGNKINDNIPIQTANNKNNSGNNNPVKTSQNNLNSAGNTSNSNLQPKQKESKAENDLEGVPADEREIVIASLKNNKIPLSEDVEKFQTPVVRGGNDSSLNSKIIPLNPVNHAVRTVQPLFGWEAEKDTEYKITVLNQAKQEIMTSETLKQGSWKIPKVLSGGFYFWRITAKKENSDAVIKSPDFFFKVIGEEETARLEKREKQIKSRLAKAIIYFRAGLFDEAEKELKAELRQNPNSNTAKKFLAQIKSMKL